jgi:hypothetical protein
VIVDLEQAKAQCDLIGDDNDDRVLLALEQAIAIVLDFLKLDSDEYEDEYGDSDYPTLVAAAILLCTQSLFQSPEQDPLTVAVKSILHRFRDPALA